MGHHHSAPDLEFRNLPVLVHQQTCLFQCDAPSSLYAIAPSNVHVNLVASSGLEIDAFRVAIERLALQHPALRAMFRTTGTPGHDHINVNGVTFHHRGALGAYVHDILRTVKVPIDVVDASSRNEREGIKAIASRVNCESDRHFMYSDPPLFRVTLFRAGDGKVFVSIVLSRLVADQWSRDIIVNDLRRLYVLAVRGDLPYCENSQANYLRVAHRESDYLTTRACDRALEFWLKVWRDYGSSQIKLADFGLPLSRCSQGAVSSWICAVPAVPANAVRECALRNGIGLRSLVLAVVAIVLSRITGRSRMALWTALPNRRHGNVANAVGPFANAHIIGITIESNARIHELLAAVHLAVEAAEEHQELPVEELRLSAGNALTFGGPRIGAHVLERDDEELTIDEGAVFQSTDVSGFGRYRVPLQVSLDISKNRIQLIGLFLDELVPRKLVEDIVSGICDKIAVLVHHNLGRVGEL